MKCRYDKGDKVETSLGNGEILTQPDEFGRCKVKFDLPCDAYGTIEAVMTTFMFGKHLFEAPSQPDTVSPMFDVQHHDLYKQYKDTQIQGNGMTYEKWLEDELVHARKRFNATWDD